MMTTDSLRSTRFDPEGGAGGGSGVWGVTGACVYCICWGEMQGVVVVCSNQLPPFSQNVEPDHNPTIEAFSNPINAQKNRYGNITCCECL